MSSGIRMPQRAIIIGAGPAGLTAAYELLTRAGIQPIVLEKSDDMGGLSRTVEFKGNRIDIGGHRFFSKSDRVMRWWLDMMPMEAGQAEAEVLLRYQNREHRLTAPAANGDRRNGDAVMLLRRRVSRILYRGRLFDYPLSLSADTVL